MEKRMLLADRQPEVGSALRKALGMSHADVVFEVRESGIRGRGGAGFPVGIKWNLAGAASGPDKVVICNADEGEPGTFKDRVLLTERTALLLEGMAIAGYAIGASTGIIYLRTEYPYLRTVIEDAARSMREKGLLGSNILGGGLDFDVEVRTGAGAYVCGEETALIESLEGGRGVPRNKPPYPVNSGYLGMPTVVNNVETFCCVPHIVTGGADWFASMGTEGCSGTKLFSVSGDVDSPGVYELPMGCTLREVLDASGAGGIVAVQVGGASGRTVGPDALDRRLSYDDLPPGGSIIVFGPERDMLDVLESFLEFFVHESCGQCTPCREGNPRLLDAVRAYRAGELSDADLASFFQLAEVMSLGSKCGLGQTSSNCFVDIMTSFAGTPGGVRGREGA